MRAWLLGAVGAAMLAAPVARACDPDEINALLTAQCRAALDPAAALIGPLRGQATPAEAPLIAALLAQATQACIDGEPAEGARLAVTLARLAGRIEARLADPPPIRPAALAR